MSDESKGGNTGPEELAHQIDETPEEEGGFDEDGNLDEKQAMRIAAMAAGAGMRDERGRILPGTPYAWKPGVSGNPAGRPTDASVLEDFREGRRKDLPAKLMTEAVRRVLDDPLVRQKLAEKWVLQSAKNAGFMKQIWERLEGKVPFTLRVGPEVEAESQTDFGITVIEVGVKDHEELKLVDDVPDQEEKPED